MPPTSRIVSHGEEPPEQLLANPANWRSHPGRQRDAIRASLDEVGWVQSIIVNRTTGHVIDGHLRIEEAISAGAPAVPVAYVELSLAEERAVLATFDPIGAMATTSKERLAELLADVIADPGDLVAFVHPLVPKAGLTDPDAVPEIPKESYVKPGDLWLLGEHRLLCGDATTELGRLMDGSLASCVWTDPPYGVAYVGKTKDALTIRNDDVGADALVQAAFATALEACEGGAPFYCTGPAGPRSLTFRLALIEAGWSLHQELVWAKDSMVLGHSDYHYKHEPIFYGYAPGKGRSGRGKHEGSRWYGDNAQVSVLAFDRPKRSTEHPTMKPVELIARCLTNSTPPGGTVLDPFVGSGSTLIAAEQTSRRCYAMDIEPRYVQVAIERWQTFTGREALRG